jgi:hypothetical protein
MRNRDFLGGDYQSIAEHRHRNRQFFGIGIVVVGLILLLKKIGVLPFLSFTLDWPIILIVIGVLIGLKRGFRRFGGWVILIIVGVINLVPEFVIFGKPSTHFIWPVTLIIGGLIMVLRPRREYCGPRGSISSSVTQDGKLDIDVTFGGKKEMITSKDFQGGMITVTFAGCELNLSQADFTTPTAVIDFRVSFGGVEMVVPSHWEIQNEINPSFGSVEDHRTLQTGTNFEVKKILILRGNCSFGSIEIKSY